MANNTILVVDDELGIRELLSEILGDEGYNVALAENAEQARNYRSQTRPDLVLLDIWMPDTDGVSLLKEWVRQNLLTMPVIMMSGHGTIETALEATRIGAVDFLEKPIALQKLLDAVAKAIRQGEMPNNCQIPASGGRMVKLGKANVWEVVEKFPLPLDLPLREARDHFDSLYFNYHMHKENGNITRVAQNAGLERTHLYRKLKQLDVKFVKKGLDDN